MGKIQEVRESIDNQLDKLEIKATAIEAQLNETMESTIPRIESLKQSYLEMLKQVKEKIDNSPQIEANKKQEMCTLIEHAEVQLALGKAEARDTIEEQRKTISRAVAELEAELDVELEEVDRETIVEMVTAAELLDAAMETAALRLESEKKDIDELLAEKKTEIKSQIEAYKKDIAEKREGAPEKWAHFEDELKGGLEKVKGAFKQLLS
jgi:hypothetical protein